MLELGLNERCCFSALAWERCSWVGMRLCWTLFGAVVFGRCAFLEELDLVGMSEAALFGIWLFQFDIQNSIQRASMLLIAECLASVSLIADFMQPTKAFLGRDQGWLFVRFIQFFAALTSCFIHRSHCGQFSLLSFRKRSVGSLQTSSGFQFSASERVCRCIVRFNCQSRRSLLFALLNIGLMPIIFFMTSIRTIISSSFWLPPLSTTVQRRLELLEHVQYLLEINSCF